jgi:hypothetical protein
MGIDGASDVADTIGCTAVAMNDGKVIVDAKVNRETSCPP